MSADFIHLHVASSFSLRYGASPPAELVQAAATHGQSALALTDRDGLYGAVRFVQACQGAGIDPILGVDLALEHEASEGDHAGWSSGRAGQAGLLTTAVTGRRQPVRGGQQVDPKLPRVTVLARGQAGGLRPGQGWARLCRLVTQTHLRGVRGEPRTTPTLVAQSARPAHPGAPAPLLVLLGPDSDVGRALAPSDGAGVGSAPRGTGGTQTGMALAWTRLQRWMQLLPVDALAIEIVNHGGPPSHPGGAAHARHLLALGTRAGIRCVASAAVRHAYPHQAATVDVLDAARRLTLLHERHLDRVSAAGHVTNAATIYSAMLRVTGDQESALARQLLTQSARLARECVQDPRTDIGIGAVHLPEPSALGLPSGTDPHRVLVRRCRDAVATRYPGAGIALLDQVHARLTDELAVVETLGYPTYFLTVAQVCDLIRDMGVRCAARGSGAGSLVNYLLGISGIEPLGHGLLMERFCTTLRAQLPDIDIDVESARRTQVYEQILERFGGERVTCVSMMDTYRVRHAIRDVGSTLGLPPIEIDALAKAFPHIRARDARSAIAELPELAELGVSRSGAHLQVLFELVERLDGLPRHIALHPCGVVLSNAQLLDRTPVEASWLGFPMSQFDKDDVETLGLLKLDVLGIRMQSAMAHAVAEISRVESTVVDLDDRAQLPLDDEATFDLIRSTRTLGCFQIESPGQRELVGKFAPSSFDDIVIDISLFRPGPVKSDMIRPFLQARQGWSEPDLLHPSLAYALDGTCGVVVFHEQVLQIVATTAGVSLAQADEVRRAMGSTQGQAQVEAWWRPRASARGYDPDDVDRIWEVLAAFASFGFCKAHAAAFALPTYQSAWLKRHHPAHFLAGVLTHDPGMYPKRLVLEDARGFGVPILGLDVNASDETYRVEWVGDSLGIRLSLADVKGMSQAEVSRVVAGRPYDDLPDFWTRAQVSRPVADRLVLAGGFDSIYGLDLGAGAGGLGRHGAMTRRDLLLHVGELERWSASLRRGSGGRRGRSGRRGQAGRGGGTADQVARVAQASLASRASGRAPGEPVVPDPRLAAAAQSRAPAVATPAQDLPTQLTLDLGDTPRLTAGTGLPEMTRLERVHAELDILGLDVTGHVLDPYAQLLGELSVVRAADLRGVRSRREILVAGVKVATQTPPVRSGRRVVFLTVEDSTGPVDATFFEDAQGPYAATVFGSWLLLVAGIVRRTGPMGVSVRATGAWELSALQQEWEIGGVDAVRALIAAERAQAELADAERAREIAAAAADGEPMMRRVLVHPSGFEQSPYADVRPPGESVRGRPGGGLVGADPHSDSGPLRKLWHASPGSSGR
ncbi:MAG: PHP domain-containing protein [Micrococcales bacterium]|nr:PHP domain-containing protein [Micrococcales bacterium]